METFRGIRGWACRLSLLFLLTERLISSRYKPFPLSYNLYVIVDNTFAFNSLHLEYDDRNKGNLKEYSHTTVALVPSSALCLRWQPISRSGSISASLYQIRPRLEHIVHKPARNQRTSCHELGVQMPLPSIVPVPLHPIHFTHDHKVRRNPHRARLGRFFVF